MRNALSAAAVAAAALLAAPASAALVHIDLSTIAFTDVTPPFAPYPAYGFTGGFDFDTATSAISNVGITSKFASYDGGFRATQYELHFTDSGSAWLLQLNVDPAALLALDAAAGDASGLTIVQDGSEYPDGSDIFNWDGAYRFGDVGVSEAAIGPDPGAGAAVPVPAAAPLLLAGLAGLAALRRRG